MSEVKEHSIYAIICRKTKRVRYVGCTSKKDVEQRVTELSSSGKLGEWLRKSTPIVAVIERVNNTRVESCRIEEKWIRRFHQEGHPLFNKRGLNIPKAEKKSNVLDLCGKLNGSKSISQILEETKNKVA